MFDHHAHRVFLKSAETAKLEEYYSHHFDADQTKFIEVRFIPMGFVV